MKLILVRHAAAIERSPGMRDEMRYLTSEGRAFFRKTARTMLKNGADPSLILTSPLLRAVQTAEILAETLSYVGPLLVVDDLAPGFNMEGLRKLMEDFQASEEVVLVGHEPDMSSLMTELLSLSDGFNFKKGSAVCMKLSSKHLPQPTVFKWLAIRNKLITSRKEAFSSP